MDDDAFRIVGSGLGQHAVGGPGGPVHGEGGAGERLVGVVAEERISRGSLAVAVNLPMRCGRVVFEVLSG